MKKETEGVQSDWTWKKGTLGFYYVPDWISRACILCRTCWGQPRNTIFKDKKRRYFRNNKPPWWVDFLS